MKKLLMLSAAALALAVAPASADTGPTTFSPATGPANLLDGTITSSITGTAATYCVLGTAQADTAGFNKNVTISTTSGPNQTATVQIAQFQGPNDQANAWHATLDLPNTICNVTSVISAQSANGGLKYTGSQSTSDPAFTTNEGLNINVIFGSDGFNSNGGNASGMTTPHVLFGAKQPSVGTFRIDLSGAADTTEHLLAGNYSDTVTITMAPKA